jgi:hypothetical protein
VILLGPALGWAAEHQYRVSVNAQLSEIEVRAELVGEVGWLAARDGDASLISHLGSCAGDSLSTRRDRIAVNGFKCLRYRHPLQTTTDPRSPRVADGVVVSTPSQWLWTPPLAAGDRIRVELALPAAVNASVPWRSRGDSSFELSASPESSRATVVFGRFQQHVIKVRGAQLRVALVDGPAQTLDSEKILAWLRVAAADVADVYGRFPNPAPQVIVQPSGPRGPGGWGGESAVPFGYVIRDGGEAVRFFVDAGRPLHDYLGDWTATHEFGHLLLPYIRSRDKWISEGFASYYQNVLLARRGVYTEQDAWRRLHRSFEKARSIRNPPRLSRMSDRPFWEMRMLIYWSGAAIALLADAELRRLSNSEESLDTVLARLQACCLPSDRPWSGEEFFAKLDELSRYPVFEDLYRRHAYGRGMPPLEDLYTRLGVVSTSSSTVRLTDEAVDAAVRSAIMQTST